MTPMKTCGARGLLVILIKAVYFEEPYSLPWILSEGETMFQPYIRARLILFDLDFTAGTI